MSQHKPGVIASEKDAAPEFSAETHPPGTAPKEHTYQPAPDSEVPSTTNYADTETDPDASAATASDTLLGATSADVHTGLGHPGQGQTSAELRHDGSRGRKKQSSGLEGVGAGGSDTRLPGDRVPGMKAGAGSGINTHDPGQAGQRALDRDEAMVGEAGGVTGRGNAGGLAAQERVPESAETVAAEAPGGR